MAQWLKHLPQKYENQSSDPCKHHACPVAQLQSQCLGGRGGIQQGGILGSVVNPTSIEKVKSDGRLPLLREQGRKHVRPHA